MKKACQDTDIAPKVIKKSSDIFADFFFINLNNSIALSVFPSNLTNYDITPVKKKIQKHRIQLQISNHFCKYIKNIPKVYLFLNLKLLRKYTGKISIWFSKSIQYTSVFIAHDRKMASEFR